MNIWSPLKIWQKIKTDPHKQIATGYIATYVADVAVTQDTGFGGFLCLCEHSIGMARLLMLVPAISVVLMCWSTTALVHDSYTDQEDQGMRLPSRKVLEARQSEEGTAPPTSESEFWVRFPFIIGCETSADDFQWRPFHALLLHAVRTASAGLSATLHWPPTDSGRMICLT